MRIKEPRRLRPQETVHNRSDPYTKRFFEDVSASRHRASSIAAAVFIVSRRTESERKVWPDLFTKCLRPAARKHWVVGDEQISTDLTQTGKVELTKLLIFQHNQTPTRRFESRHCQARCYNPMEAKCAIDPTQVFETRRTWQITVRWIG